MAREIQPKKKVMPISSENLEDGYMKAMTTQPAPVVVVSAPTSVPTPPVAIVEKVVEKAAAAKEHRLTIDISNEIFTLMDEHRKETGQSYKGLITFLLKQHFVNK